MRRNERGCDLRQSFAMATSLTPREMDVLGMLAQGKSVRQIADALDITERSARAHMQRIVEALAVSDSAEAVAAALRAGLIAL